MKKKIIQDFGKIKAVRDRKLEKEFLAEAMEIVEKPTSPLGRFSIWITTILLVVVLAWSIIGRVDEVAFSRGKINSVSGLQIIQPVNGGKVTQLSVKEGEYVKAGQAIIQLDTTQEDIILASKEEILSTLRYQNKLLNGMLKEQDISLYHEELLSEDEKNLHQYLLAMVDEYQNKRVQAEQSVSQAQKQVETQEGILEKMQINIDLLNEKYSKWQEIKSAGGTEQLTLEKYDALIAVAEKEVSDYRALYEAGAIPKYEWETKENALLELNKNLDIQKAKAAMEGIEQLDNIDTISKQIETAHKEFSIQESTTRQAEEAWAQTKQGVSVMQAEYMSNISNMLVENNAAILSQENEYRLQKEQIKTQTVVSPVNGYVQNLAINTIGGVVTPAQPIATIVPDDSGLLMEVDLLNKDIAFIEMGQDVVVKLDTFPYQKYGKISGKVVYISPDAVKDEQKGLIYKGKISLEPTELTVSVGMEGTAEIKVSDRRIIEFFLSPIMENLDKSLKVR